MADDTLSEEQQHDCFLKSLTNNTQLSLLLNEFIEHLASQIGYKSFKIISESVHILKQYFREKEINFEEKLEKRVLSEMRINFTSRTTGMIETFSDTQAWQKEAEIEYSTDHNQPDYFSRTLSPAYNNPGVIPTS